MSPVFPRVLRLRALALPWLILWMLVVPLVHLHPEADHRHGNAGHVHGSTVHTVFSPDLHCEYAAHHRRTTSPGKVSGPLELVGQATHALNHPEIGFSLLASSADRHTGKTGFSQAVSPEGASELLVNVALSAPELFLTCPMHLFLASGLSSRPPPPPTL